jgi:uncharacterized membrane protein YccC
VWSKAAAYRALRATIVIPALFAVTYRVIGDLQMATYAAFGGFATLVFAAFVGHRRDKLVAHLLLGLVGSGLLVIGTAVTDSTAVAAIVTVPVVFCVLFSGIAGPNAASGATAALLAYVLAAASPGDTGMIPARLAGWWLATAAGTVAVLLLSPRPESDRLRGAASESAAALAADLAAALDAENSAGVAPADQLAVAAKHTLMGVFASTPYRPTGLAGSDQALASLVEALEWCTALVTDLVREGTDLSGIDAGDRALLETAGEVLADTARVLRGADNVRPALERLEDLTAASAARVAALGSGDACTEREVHVSFHARIVAAAAERAALDALIATGQSEPVAGAESRLRSSSSAPPGSYPVVVDHWTTWGLARRLVGGHASVRSVWFLNSVRGAVGVAAAVAVADLSNVQHGFWVVLGTLSMLRTNAASTGSTALRALAGTAAGFFIGAGLIVAIGHDTAALWATLPIAVLVASYAPGTVPFAVGQAAFTVLISVLFNILVPVGWRVGVLRLEDVAIGAAVSALVGLLFWPRGAGAVVAYDLADAFHDGGLYLVQATAWAVGDRDHPPDAGGRAANAGLRLDDALRGLAAEQGTKRVPREHLWRLVGGTMRLRMTAESLSALPRPEVGSDAGRRALVEEAARLAGWCDGAAAQLGRAPATVARELASVLFADSSVLSADSATVPVEQGYLLWVRHHIDHVKRHLADLVDPLAAVAERRVMPWWR